MMCNYISLSISTHCRMVLYWVHCYIWGFPKIRGSILGVLIIRNIVYWGPYWGPLISGNYHIGGASLCSPLRGLRLLAAACSGLAGATAWQKSCTLLHQSPSSSPRGTL